MDTHLRFRRILITVILIIFSFVLQTTLFNGISFSGIVPNLLMILTASFGFMSGEKTGLLIGFFCGLLGDIFFSSFLGLNALLFMYIGYLNGKFHKIFYPDDIKLPLALILCSDFAYGVMYYLTLFLLRGKFQFTYYLIHIILPETVYTILVTLLFYPFILWLNNRLEEREKRSNRKFV